MSFESDVFMYMHRVKDKTVIPIDPRLLSAISHSPERRGFATF